MSEIVLLGSVFLPAAAYEPLAAALAARGHRVRIAQPGPAATAQDALAAYRSALGERRGLVGVAHSNAGAYMPALVADGAVRSAVFMDASRRLAAPTEPLGAPRPLAAAPESMPNAPPREPNGTFAILSPACSRDATPAGPSGGQPLAAARALARHHLAHRRRDLLAEPAGHHRVVTADEERAHPVLAREERDLVTHCSGWPMSGPRETGENPTRMKLSSRRTPARARAHRRSRTAGGRGRDRRCRAP
ncbi:hypothetical protein [Agromyces sp. CCNWLW208]|uniref:hypothetical protein n=1 Tax=unclassified Agromyces TaxID=2639701 RepID=UPI003014D184